MFPTRLETFLDKRHSLMQLGARIDWEWFEDAYSGGFDERGLYALSVRLVVWLTFLKHSENLSDEALLEKWVKNPYWQQFCVFEYFQHTPPCDPTSLSKWRGRPRISNGCKAVHTARCKLVQRAAKEGLVLRQSYARVGKQLLFKHGRYRHAKQFKRAQKALKRMRNRLCRQGLSRKYPLA